jgi:D-arabinose 1-dehydrogenase-like Zn-dependent alcohol dehydrogenase
MADGAVAQALVLEAPRRLVVWELPLPNLGDDDALVRVAACGLCGTDHEQFTGELAGGSAFVPGHETVGTIDAIGPERHSVGGWPPATGWPALSALLTDGAEFDLVFIDGWHTFDQTLLAH